VTNSGAGTAHGVAVDDLLPTNAGTSWTIDVVNSSTGWTISSGHLRFGPADLGANSSTHVHITSGTTTATCGIVNNSASFTSTNAGSGSVGPIGITVNCATLGITKTRDAASVNAGDTIGYVVT